VSLFAQKVPDTVLFGSAWTDPETGLRWLHGQDCRSFADYCGWPVAVERQGFRFVKTGWNSDTGAVYYRQVTDSDLLAFVVQGVRTRAV